MTALVASGVPAEQITSLSMLAHPLDNAVKILDFHRQRLHKKKLATGEAFTEDELRSSNLKGIGELLRQIGKFEAGLSEGDLDELKEYIAMVTPNTEFGMSEKNRIRLTALFEDPAYSMLLGLPAHWMKLAADPERDPDEAARMAMYAAALEVLSFLPLRRMNLAATEDRRQFAPAKTERVHQRGLYPGPYGQELHDDPLARGSVLGPRARHLYPAVPAAAGQGRKRLPLPGHQRQPPRRRGIRRSALQARGP